MVPPDNPRRYIDLFLIEDYDLMYVLQKKSFVYPGIANNVLTFKVARYGNKYFYLRTKAGHFIFKTNDFKCPLWRCLHESSVSPSL